MKINKQLFEDVLSGKLKGTFVLRNKIDIETNNLIRNISNSYYVFPYKIYNRTYAENGLMCKTLLSEWDIVDFIPDTNMKEKELKIEIPEGFEIDKEKSTFEKIVFKPINTKPRSWEEYCEQQKANNKEGYYISNASCVTLNISWSKYFQQHNFWKDILPTKELAEAFLAMMQLMSLRQEWIGDWKPDWRSDIDCKYCVVGICCNFEVLLLNECRYPLSFPTKEMATDFRNTFKDLLNVARPLI